MQEFGSVLVGLLFIGLIFGIPLWALIDALSTPREIWRAVGRERAPWVALIIFTGMIGALAYFIAPRHDLRRGTRLP